MKKTVLDFICGGLIGHAILAIGVVIGNQFTIYWIKKQIYKGEDGKKTQLTSMCADIYANGYIRAKMDCMEGKLHRTNYLTNPYLKVLKKD